MSHLVDMRPAAIEARLVAASHASPLGFQPLARVDMSAAAVELRLEEWAELTTLCTALGHRTPIR